MLDSILRILKIGSLGLLTMNVVTKEAKLSSRSASHPQLPLTAAQTLKG